MKPATTGEEERRMAENEMSTQTYWDRRGKAIDEEAAWLRTQAETPENRRDALGRKLDTMYQDRGRYTDAEIATARHAYEAARAECA